MSIDKRKHIRFESDTNTFVGLRIDETSIGGLCITESHGGCSAVFLNHKLFVAGKTCEIHVGKLSTLNAEIRWVTELDSDVVKVGFEYLE